MVSRDHPLGSTPLPKVAERVDHGTKFADVMPYVENRKMHATSTVVNIKIYSLILIYYFLIYLSGQKLIISKKLPMM